MLVIGNDRLTVSRDSHDDGGQCVGGNSAAVAAAVPAAIRRPSEFKRELISTIIGEGGRNTSLAKRQNGEEGMIGMTATRRTPNTAAAVNPIVKYSINRQGGFYLFWMGVVSVCVFYNASVIPLRASFTQVQGTMFAPPGQLKGPPRVVSPWKLAIWLFMDFMFDLLYLLDILLVQWRVGIKDEAINSNDKEGEGAESEASSSLYQKKLFKAALQYVRHWYFWLDVVAVLPYEVLYAIPFLRFNPLVRLPRLLKIRHLRFFLNHFENYTDHPHAFRLFKSYAYLIYLIHIFTCIHYGISERQGFGSTDWVYDGKGFSYIRCFHLAFLIVSTIRSQDSNQPTNNVEYIIELCGSLIGVFFMAVIISNISAAVVAAHYKNLLMHKKRDMLREYLQRRKISKQLEKRVEMWLEYAFTQRNVLNDKDALCVLPFKMRSDLVIHGMLDTLSKVRIFQGFPNSLLRELVLRLKPTLFIPGDCICLKGEIGREMYIVNQGLAVVVGGASTNTVLAELGPGSIFGEISLLSSHGGNRRTATVVSKGFTHLFVLSNKDLSETISDYPEAKVELSHKANNLLKKDKLRKAKEESRTSFEDYCSPQSSTCLDDHQQPTTTKRRGLSVFFKSSNQNDICQVNIQHKENDDEDDAWKTEFFPFVNSTNCSNSCSWNSQSVCKVAWN